MTDKTTLWKGDMQVGTLTEIVENRIGATARLQIEDSASELMRDYIQYDISLRKGEQEIPWNEIFRTVIDSGDWKLGVAQVKKR